MEDTKICRKCNVEKPWTSYQPRGRVCRTEYHKQWYQDNKETHKEQRDAWYAENKERHKEMRDLWRLENADLNKEINSIYRIANRDVIDKAIKQTAAARLCCASRSFITVTITPDRLVEIWHEQKGLCAVSGLAMVYAPDRSRAIRKPHTPSIDRIKPDLGYVEGNVRWVCVAVNTGMGAWGEEEYIAICESVVAFNKNKLNL